MARGRLGTILGSLILASVVGGGCAPDHGTAIVNEIKASRDPLIAEIRYEGDEDESGPLMEIYLVPGATPEQALDLVCDIVWPAVNRGSPPPGFGFDVLSRDGMLLASDDADCDGTP